MSRLDLFRPALELVEKGTGLPMDKILVERDPKSLASLIKHLVTDTETSRVVGHRGDIVNWAIGQLKKKGKNNPGVTKLLKGVRENVLSNAKDAEAREGYIAAFK